MLPYIEKINYENAPKDVAIYLVDGEYVRNNLGIEFTSGGHDLVYPFIPSGEVWIEESVDPGEVEYILLHELDERESMKEGLGYEDAHDKANQYESLVRSSGKLERSAGKDSIILEPQINDLLEYAYDRYPECVGIRFLSSDYSDIDLPVGHYLSESNRWEDGDYTDEPLGGVSVIAEPFRYPKEWAGYWASRVVVVGGHSVMSGQDEGEAIIENAYIIADIPINDVLSKQAYKINKEDLLTLWYEDDKGNFIEPVNVENPYDPIPPNAAYQVSRFPHVLRTTYLALDDEGSHEVFYGESSFPEDLVVAMVESGDFTLNESIIIAAESCERCLNSLLYDYGLDEGYPEGSEEWKKANTVCDFCRHLGDPRKYVDEAFPTKVGAGSDALQTYEQEIGSLLEEVRRWRKELSKNPQQGKEIVDGVSRYMRTIGPRPSKALEQVVRNNLEQARWKGIDKYLEMSGMFDEPIRERDQFDEPLNMTQADTEEHKKIDKKKLRKKLFTQRS